MPRDLFLRRDPWWEDGPAARRERRRRRVVGVMAFLMSLAAVTGAGYMWAFHLGLAGRLALPIG